jgi:hypothetical protein
MNAAMNSYSLDREASGFSGMEDDELQRLINKWIRQDDPSDSPDCTFTKRVLSKVD